MKIASLVLIAAIAIGLIIGCGEEEMENPVAVEGVVGMLSDLKTLDSAPGAPQLIPEGTPTVKSVGYYSDWKLTKPLSGIIPVGKTIFVKVKFSEKMKLVVADDKHARPILYRKIDGKRTRFNVANFGATGEDFVSGDAKPIKTKTSFVCKYVVQPEDGGEFVFCIGKWSIDLEGNLLPAFYTHKEKLWLGKPLSPVKSVEYYSNWQLTKPLSGTIKSGTTVFTKIVFSEEMKYVVADGAKARPQLYYRIGDRDVQHNIVPFKSQGRFFVSGDTKPIIDKNRTFVGKYQIKSGDFGAFTLIVGKDSANARGVKPDEEYVHTKALHMPDPPAPVVTLTGAPTGIDNSDTILVTVRGSGVTHYKYSVSAGKECVEYGQPVQIYSRITADVSELPDGTVTLCVLGKNIAGVWQTKPTTVQWTRDSTVVLKPPVITGQAETDGDISTVPGTSVPDIPTTRTIAPPGAQDFAGFVYTPNIPTIRRRGLPRVEAQPIAGVTVTIVSGSRSGEQIMTNRSGQYIFRGVEEDELRLRVEKSGFESKEVIVHRSGPTRLFNGTISKLFKDPQNTPSGNILIGHRWPDEVRFILEKTRVVDDLLFVRVSEPNDWGGNYINGVAMIHTENVRGTDNILGVIAHEIAHAHQHAVVPLIPTADVRQFKFADINGWENTSEGKAYAEARREDHKKFGVAKYETIGYSANLKENAAEFSAYFWSIGRWNRDIHSDLKKVAPNRLKWAEKWLTKK